MGRMHTKARHGPWHLSYCARFLSSLAPPFIYDTRLLSCWCALARVPYMSSAPSLQHGAEVIYDTDDDNILLDSAAKAHWLGFLPSQTIPPQALEYIPRPDR